MEGESLSVYTMRLEDALKNKTPFFTHNLDIRHAFAIIVSVFLHANKEILLLSHELERIFYGHRSMLAAIQKFLNRKGRLRVLVEERIDADHPMLELAKSWSGQVSIHQVPKEEQDYKFNFLIMDDCGYRFEPNREKKSASASFYSKSSKELIGMLRDRFEELEAKSVPISTDAAAI